jgi:hypothetical protein
LCGNADRKPPLRATPSTTAIPITTEAMVADRPKRNRPRCRAAAEWANELLIRRGRSPQRIIRRSLGEGGLSPL